jgi:hypothetical protein
MTQRQYIRYLLVGFGAVYVASVGMCVLVKLTLSPTRSWPEVFYGPLITVACCLALVLSAFWLGRAMTANSDRSVPVDQND